jgi:hypothetical protein
MESKALALAQASADTGMDAAKATYSIEVG